MFSNWSSADVLYVGKGQIPKQSTIQLALSSPARESKIWLQKAGDWFTQGKYKRKCVFVNLLLAA